MWDRRHNFILKGLVLLASLLLPGAASIPAPRPSRERAATVRLGERLFRDARFSTPKGDLPASCSTCHMLDEDPQGVRAYADFFNRSWVSSRMRDRRRLEIRNSPTIFDVADMPRLHFDGEFASLEDLVKGTLAGRPMGWLPGEEDEAFARVRTVLREDKAEGRNAEATYREQFRNALGVEIENLTERESVDLVARAVADYMRTLRTPRDTAYDRFVAMNGLETRPATGETAKVFATRLLAQIESLESKNILRLPENFSADALSGLKIFFRVEGTASAGNCVSCHAPPMFTDHGFHNLGISQREYDRIHGEGKFAAMKIPGMEVRRPVPHLREIPSSSQEKAVDLGYWNFVDLKRSSQRRRGESEERFLRRMIGTFKTPTVRNLRYTFPYFHDGSVNTLEDAMKELIELSLMARTGRVREADDDLAKIRISATDIKPLAAFLQSLNDELAKTTPKRSPRK